ncbi:MAG: ATP-dependent helicase C-terminal domain-containing protein, partial [Bacteroidota bacterium]
VEVSEQKTNEAAGASKLKSELLKWAEEFKLSGDFRRWQFICQYQASNKNLSDFEWDLFLEEFLLDMKKPDPDTHHDFLRRLNEELQLFIDPTFVISLKKSCPERFELHERKSCPIHYELNQPPWIEAYIQDFYSTKSHPSLFQGKLPLTVHLWGPHGRALQVTGDLPGFWQRHYPQLKKELQREYPRYFWPEDPLTAAPMLRLPRNK